MRQAVLAVVLIGLNPAAYATPIVQIPIATSATTLQWTSCGKDTPENLQCAQLEVPMDWSNVTGTKIILNMSRLKVTNDTTRIGSLIVNPGGPGGAATDLCYAQALGVPYFTEALTSHFDLICLDPRGVGTSNPIRCDPDLWNIRQTSIPSSNSAYDEMTSHYKALGESCLEHSGDLVKYVDTVSVAKDFEAVRVALDDGKLNYLGLSYGSQIGTTYAELYPENIRAMALDGILDHSASNTYFTVTESETYEAVLDRFFDWCNKTVSCALYGQNVAKVFEDVVNQADLTPIPAPDCLQTSNNTRYAGTCFANTTGEDIRFNTQSLLISKARGWNRLGLALSQASSGNATLLSSPRAADENSSVWQGLIVGCLDWQRSADFAENENKQQLLGSVSPYTKGASQSWTYQSQCAGWPIPISNPQRELNATAMALTPPILLVNSYYDPSTSYTWANSVKDQVPNGVLLTRNGEGHTSYLLRGEATAATDAFLVKGTLPAANTVVQT